MFGGVYRKYGKNVLICRLGYHFRAMVIMFFVSVDDGILSVVHLTPVVGLELATHPTSTLNDAFKRPQIWDNVNDSDKSTFLGIYSKRANY